MLSVFAEPLQDRMQMKMLTKNEPRCEKTGLRGFRPDLTQTGLYNHTRWLDVCDFEFKK